MFGSKTLKRLVLATLGALLLALAASAPAGAAWSDEFVSSSSLTTSVEEPPGAAADADGDFFYVWTRNDGVIQARTRSAAGRLGKVLTLSQTGLEHPEASMARVGVNGDGDALFAWHTMNTAGTQNLIVGRYRSAAGQLGPIQTLLAQSKDAGEIIDIDVALSNNDTGVVAWHQDGVTSDIKAKTRSATGRMGPTLTVSSSGIDGEASLPEVEMDSGGEAVFAWQQATATVDGRIQTRTLSSTGRLGSAKTLASSNATFGNEEGAGSQLAVNPRGDAAFTWTRTDLATGKDVVEGRLLTDDGVLKAAQKLSAGQTEVSDPEVDIANNGASVYAWGQKSLTVGKVQLLGRSLGANGTTLGRTQTLSGTTNDVFGGHVGVEGDGDALFLWEDKHPTLGKPIIQARALTAAGALRPVTTVAQLESQSQGLDLAVAANGKATAAWLNGSVKRVQAAFGP